MIKKEYFESFEIYTDGTQSTNLLDVGYINLRCKGRSYAIDTGVPYCYPDEEPNRTEYNLVFVETDEYEGFEDIDFDLTNEDLLDSELVATVWLDGEEFEDDITSMILIVNVNGTVRKISCTEEE